ncbi:MAG: DUF2752 domain-containing protein [Planctomycetes bacterium]|nr:DUF2752 domain-containing protein [Planctomycetota bacterium]
MKPATWISLGALVVLALSVVLTPQTLPEVSTCVFYAWTGVPCAGCGMTRAFCSLGHADWSAAWSYHPLSFPLYAAFVVAALWPLLSRAVPGVGLLVRPSVLLLGGIGFALALAAFGFWRAWDLIAARF